MNMKLVEPSAPHFAFRKALEATMREHASEIRAADILAILSHLVGQVIALQDQRTMTPDAAMDLVVANIGEGNRDVIAQLLSETGGAA